MAVGWHVQLTTLSELWWALLSTMVIYLFLWGILFVTSWSKNVMACVEAAVLGQGSFG